MIQTVLVILRKWTLSSAVVCLGQLVLMFLYVFGARRLTALLAGLTRWQQSINRTARAVTVLNTMCCVW